MNSIYAFFSLQFQSQFFVNYGKYVSVLHGIGDPNYKFIVIDVGDYSEQSNHGILKSADFHKLLSTKELDIPVPYYPLQATEKAPFILIGEETYFPLPYLLFVERKFNIEQACFNKHVSLAKVLNVYFGILIAKWRLLLKCFETDIATADNIMKCTFTLYNTIVNREYICQIRM